MGVIGLTVIPLHIFCYKNGPLIYTHKNTYYLPLEKHELLYCKPSNITKVYNIG